MSTAAATEVYYQDMASSLGDKERMLAHLLPGTVADIGSGGGVLSQGLLDRGFDVVGLDPNPRPIPGVDVHQLFADEVPQAAPKEKFDNVIACAVLHEVFSYGNRDGKVGRIASVGKALTAFRRSLKPGGRLVVRDGVRPCESQASMRLHTWTDDDIQRFLDASPFTKNKTDVSLALTKGASGEWAGSASSIMEAVLTLTWGEDAFEREVQEFYGLFSLAEYSQYVEQFGFQLIMSEAYTQPEYRENLEGVVTLDGFTDGFPHTNALWVYEAV